MTDSQDFIPPAGLQPKGPARYQVASYGKRLLAFLIDGLCLVTSLMLLIQFLGITDLDISKYADSEAMQKAFIEKIISLPHEQQVLLVLGPYIIFFILHGYLLSQFGQTLGKRLVGLAIVTLNDEKPPFWPLIAQRYLPQWLVSSIPMLGPLLRLVDVLYIFNNPLNACLHDKLARTKVVDLSQPEVTSSTSESRIGVLEV